jgi:hypothetical protein
MRNLTVVFSSCIEAGEATGGETSDPRLSGILQSGIRKAVFNFIHFFPTLSLIKHVLEHRCLHFFI